MSLKSISSDEVGLLSGLGSPSVSSTQSSTPGADDPFASRLNIDPRENVVGPYLADNEPVLDGNDPHRNSDNASPNNFASNVNESDTEPVGPPIVDIDSFLPVLRTLSGLVLLDNTYYLRGAVSKEDLKQLLAYTRRVEGFTLTKSSDEQSISTAAIFRLLHIHNLPEPFFPSLKRLRIINPDLRVMQFWSFFLTPSLKSLEVAHVSEEHQDALLSLLITLLDEAPQISSIKFGPGRIPVGSVKQCVNFTHIRELHLLNVVSTTDYSFLTQIGELPMLETLGFSTPIPTTYTRARQQSQGSMDADMLEELPLPCPLTPGFRKLKALRVVAILEILEDLIGQIDSNELKEISITLLTSPGLALLAAKRLIKNGMRITPKNEDEVFASLVDSLLRKWTETLTSICVFQQQEGHSTLRPHFLSITTTGLLLSQQSLERLEIDGWNLQYNFQQIIKIVSDATPSRFRVLHLPIEVPADGISLTLLPSVGQVWPNLVSFQYNIKDLSNIPDYIEDSLIPKELPNSSIETLSFGNGPLSYPSGDEYYLLRVAQYLDNLFPNLKTIKTDEGENSKDWRYIERLIKMCQVSRSCHSS